jgi:nucleoside-diphosphate-sugar epimerase
MDSKAIVFGATGFTGREVARELVQRGVKTIAHIRPDSPRLAEWRDRFQKMGAQTDDTPWQETAIAKTLADFQPAILFCLIGTIRARIKQAVRQGKDPETQDYMAVDYGLTVMLLEAAKAAKIKPRFIYLSAAGAGKPGTTPYGKARHLAEQAVINSGIPYVICRPSFIIGPDRDDKRSSEIFGAKMIDGLLHIPSALGLKKFRERYRSTSNLILARALVRIALDPGSVGKNFESEQLRA